MVLQRLPTSTFYRHRGKALITGRRIWCLLVNGIHFYGSFQCEAFMIPWKLRHLFQVSVGGTLNRCTFIFSSPRQRLQANRARDSLRVDPNTPPSRNAVLSLKSKSNIRGGCFTSTGQIFHALFLFTLSRCN